MILRKPYAFLIRKFKIIHLLITLCSIYLISKISSLLNYYNSFIGGTVGKLEAGKYFGSFYIFVVIIAIVICLVILMLMKYKNKSYLFYIIMIGYFFVSGLLINYSLDGLYQIYFSSLDIKTLLLHRDIIKIFNFIQYFFLVMPLIRGLGFDIKKFNFVDDLVELNEDVTDNEEVELTLDGLEGYNRKFNRRIREFKYYYLENKFIINIIIGVILLISIGGYVLDKKIFNPIYNTNDTFSFDNFTFKVLDTYVTNIDYDNQKVLDDDNSLVLVKMNVTSDSNNIKINTGNIILKMGDVGYSTVIASSKRFKDLGSVYSSQIIKEDSTYLFPYKVPNDKLKEEMKLVFRNEKKVNLSPVYLDELEDVKNYKLGDKLDLSDTIYGSGYFNIKSYEVKDSFKHSYKYEVLDQSYDGSITIFSSNNIIMNLVMDSEFTDNYDKFSFLKKYAKLNYTIDDKSYTSRVFENKTPGSYKDGLYLSVSKKIGEASAIWFDIVVRNKHYVYKLK